MITVRSPAPARTGAGREKLSDWVVGQLEADIVNGKYAVGARLPTETELCAALGVSRSVVRDALRTLESANLVSVQQGRGIVVAAPSDSGITDALGLTLARSDLTMGQVVAGRAALESALAAEAALRGTAEDWVRLRRCLEEFAGAVASARWTAAHRAHLRFHLGIVHALHSPALDVLLRPLHRVIVVSSLPPEVDRQELWGVACHEPIVAALESGAPAAARAAVDHHFAFLDTADYAAFRATPFREAHTLAAYRTLAGVLAE